MSHHRGLRVLSHLVPGHGTKLWVPKLSFVHFAPSADAIFAKGAKKLTVVKRSHRDPVPTLVPKYKVDTLYSGTGTVPEF